MKPLEQTVRFKNAKKKLRLANARFKKLSKKEQRIAIAKDVIAQVKAGRILPTSAYFQVSNAIASHLHAAGALELGTVIASCTSKNDPCEVCGIGSLFVSAVLKADKLKIKDFDFSSGVRKQEVQYLERWFDAMQLVLIEAHYEVSIAGIGCSNVPAQRMIMIMENIISNGGKFDPYKGAHKVEKST